MPGPCSKVPGGKTSYVRQHSTGEHVNMPPNLERRINSWNELMKGPRMPTEYHKPGSRTK